MPNRSTHTWVGALTALAVGYIRSRELQGADKFFHNAGAALGGAFAGRLPDILEPALSPHHRQFYHGLLPNAVFWFLATRQIEKAYQCIVGEALRYEPLQGAYPWQRGLLFTVAGFVQAVPPGYISHLVLDGATPFGLPVFGWLSA